MKIGLPSASFFASALITFVFGISYECMSPIDLHNLSNGRIESANHSEHGSYESSYSLVPSQTNTKTVGTKKSF